MEHIKIEMPSTPAEGGPDLTRGPDGWTPERIRIFLQALSECGVVADAARAAGMSKSSAYAFRNSARGRSFDTGWRAALLLARGRLADEVMSRALNGYVEVTMRDGQVWQERHRYDNRLTMAVLARLDQLAGSASQLDDGPRRIAHEFDAFVDAVGDGNAKAADFLQSRDALSYRAFAEAEIIARNEEYLLAGEGGDESAWGPSTSSTLLDSAEAPGAPKVAAPASNDADDTGDQRGGRPTDDDRLMLDVLAQLDQLAETAPSLPEAERTPRDDADLLGEQWSGENAWGPSTSSTLLDSAEAPGTANLAAPASNHAGDIGDRGSGHVAGDARLALAAAQCEGGPPRMAQAFGAFSRAVCEGNDAADFAPSRAALSDEALAWAERIARDDADLPGEQWAQMHGAHPEVSGRHGGAPHRADGEFRSQACS